jgi:hypothetical protein
MGSARPESRRGAVLSCQAVSQTVRGNEPDPLFALEMSLTPCLFLICDSAVTEPLKT